MEIYLIRHTTPQVEKGICYGQTDLAVTANFPEELERLKKHLPVDFDLCYTSPLQRCAQLAQELAAEPIVDDRLKEMDFGDWEMKPWASIPQDVLNPWMEDFVRVPVPGGESFGELIERVKAVWQEISTQEVERILVVTHGGVIRSVLGHVLQLDPKHSFKMEIDYGGVSMVAGKGGFYKVKFINR